MQKILSHYRLLLCFLVPTLGYAAEVPPLTFRGNLSLLGAGSAAALSDSKLNIDNTTLQLPDRQVQADIRPNLKIESRNVSLVARPRLSHRLTSAEVNTKRQSQKTTITSRWNEAFLQWNASESVTFSYGIQNFQWGPAESLNPSNRIFHEGVLSRDYLYEPRGKYLSRLNIHFHPQASLMVITQFDETEDEEIFRAEEEPNHAALLKPEFSWNSGADYLGLVLGGREKGKAWFGEYGNLSLWDSWNIFFDASHERENRAWYPVSQNVGPNEFVHFDENRGSETKITTLVAGGIRYSFEGGSDWRAEYLYNAAGYRSEEIDQRRRLHQGEAFLQDPQNNLPRLGAPGLELIGQRYVFTSWRSPDLFSIKDLSLYLRYLHSLSDASGVGYTSLEYGASDHVTVWAAGSGARGKAGDDLKTFENNRVTLGLRYDI